MRALTLAVLAAIAAAPLAAQNTRSTEPRSAGSRSTDTRAAEAAVARAKACDAAAAGKNLSDAQYRAYLKACLASTRPPAQLFESARSIERRCNTIANARQLSAEERVTFMASCRRKGG